MTYPIFTKRARQIAVTFSMAVLLAACGGGEKSDAMLASARDYLAKNDPKAAVIQLKNALQASPELVEGRYLLGLALLRSGDPVGGETELRKALELKHPRELVLPPLAEAMLAQQQYKKLTDEFGSTELGQPAAQAGLKTSLTSAYTEQGKAELAQAALAAALAADPAYAPALRVQARDKAIKRDFDGALQLLESMLAKTPTDHEAWKIKGDVLLYGKGQATEALVAYRKAVEVKPDFPEGHSAIVTTLSREGNVADAAKQLAELKKLAPGSLQTRYLETLLAFQKKDFKLARELSQQLIKMAPDYSPSLQLAGAVELQFNSLLQAETYLAKALHAVPESILARRLLVSTYLRAGQAGKALTTLQPALKIENLDGATTALAGEVFLQNGDTKKAEEYFAKAAKIDPKNPKVRTSLALTRLAGGREEQAFGELQALAASESSSTADLALISAHLQRQDYDKALKAIDGLEKKQPDKPLASNLRGRTLLAKKDIAGARKSFERALEIDPTYFVAAASLAALDVGEKKPEDARKRFEAILAKDPNNVGSSRVDLQACKLEYSIVSPK